MTLPDPKFAPRRSDLPWLRRRRVKRAPTQAAPAPQPTAPSAPRPAPKPTTTPRPAPVTASGPPRGSGGKIDYTRRDRTPARAPAPAPTSRPAPPPAPTTAPEPAPAAASSSTSLDLSGPAPTPAPTPTPAPPPPSTPAPTSGGSTSLDLGSPPPPAPPTPPAASTSLDLGGGPAPTAPPSPAPAASTSLDLGATPPGEARRGARAAPPPAKPPRHHVVRHTRSGATTLLDFGAPVVTLDRLQSGIGELTVDVVVGDEVGDLRVGAAWALTDGRSGTVELAAERRHGPEGRRAVVWAGREGRFERIALDLRQVGLLSRLLVYAFSPTKASLTWGGTVVVTTYGGDRIDAPIVSAPSPACLALLTVYNVDGELVVRSEMDPVAGSVRDTCRAFGYDRITWLDDRTPVT